MIDYRQIIAADIFADDMGLASEEIAEMIEIPTNSEMGDFAFPCFRLAKTLRKSPAIIASEIANRLNESNEYDKVENVNAYVNFFLNRSKFAENVIPDINKEGDDYGKTDYGQKKTVIVEFSSPNIAKPFHIGHIRSTVIGNSIAKLYDAIGYDVVKINHLGDYGTQFGKMIVAYRRWGNEDELKANPIKSLLAYYTKFHVEAEKSPELDEEARLAFSKLESGEEEEVMLWKKFRKYSLAEFGRVYDMLGISFDSYAGESFYSDKMPAVVEELKEKNLLVESQGAQIVDLEPYGMTPAVILKSDGSSLYATRDIAAAIYRKNTYNFYKNIYVVASQQNLHFKQWRKVLELMGYEWNEDCVHVPFGLVSLEEGTMSTRHGRVVFLEDVLNNAVAKTKEIMMEKNQDTQELDDIASKVGIGAVIFQELSNNRIKDYVFNWDKVLNFDGETGPYVQYTYARATSVLKNANKDELKKAKVGDCQYKYLESESAYNLTKLLYRVPAVIMDAAIKYEPSILTRHLVDIAQAFNKFYHDEHILTDNEEEKIAKLSLVISSRTVISNCLRLLGIASPERM